MKRAFFDQPALELARALLGKILYHRATGDSDGDGERSGRIVETEAYVGMEDAACHARSGPKGRARRMFGPPGYAYVYLIYGMYDCFNIVSGPGEFPAAVLIRALEVDETLARANGPGKLTRSLGITRAHDGADLVKGDVLGVRDGRAPNRIVATPRIGIDYAGEWVSKPWRFVDADSPALSRRLTSTTKASKHRR